MNNLKIIAACLVVVFIGLFVFDTVKKKGRKIASSDKGRIQSEDVIPKKSKIKIQVIKKGARMPKWKGNEMALQDKTISEKNIDLTKMGTGKYTQFPVYKGRKVIQVYGGKINPPTNVPKKFLVSNEEEHSELSAKVVRFFYNLGFNEDNKMKVVRGEGFLALQGDEAIKVEAFTISYNWNGQPRKETWLMRTINARMYKKLSIPLDMFVAAK